MKRLVRPLIMCWFLLAGAAFASGDFTVNGHAFVFYEYPEYYGLPPGSGAYLMQEDPREDGSGFDINMSINYDGAQWTWGYSDADGHYVTGTATYDAANGFVLELGPDGGEIPEFWEQGAGGSNYAGAHGAGVASPVDWASVGASILAVGALVAAGALPLFAYKMAVWFAPRVFRWLRN